MPANGLSPTYAVKLSEFASAINSQPLLLDCNCCCGDCHCALIALKLAATRMTAIIVVVVVSVRARVGNFINHEDDNPMTVGRKEKF